MNNANKIWAHLIAAGLSPCGAAALMGNLQAESRLDPQNLQDSFEGKLGHTNATYTAAVDAGTYGNFICDGAGYGLAQWTYSTRKENLLLYARRIGASIGDLNMQIAFLLHELQNDYPGVLAVLKSTNDLYYASDLVLMQYERPADQGDNQRRRRANCSHEYYKRFAKERTTMATIAEKRQAVISKYEEIIGRNKYSQTRRGYAYKKYSDGKYYSDCSSSIALAHKEAGYPFYDNNGSYNPNTVGMYQAKSLVDVPVEIKDGVIQNPEVLQPCDMLLFAGSDTSRKYADYVGHVEMVGKISNGKVTIYGHGSGTPRKTEMNAYCKKRFKQKTSTKKGNKGLLKVRRLFVEEDEIEPVKPIENGVEIAPGTWNVRKGPGKEFASVGFAEGGDVLEKVEIGDWIPVHYAGEVCFISPMAKKQ